MARKRLPKVTTLLLFAVLVLGTTIVHAKSKSCFAPTMFDDLLRPSKWGTSKHNETVSQELRNRLKKVDSRIDIGNVGISKGTIDGKDFNLVAHNGPESVRGTLPSITDDGPRKFEYPRQVERENDAWRRRNDAEAKIFEHLAKQLKPSSQGSLTIFSEKPLCHSCANVLKQFRKQYPKIEVDIKVHQSQSSTDATWPSWADALDGMDAVIESKLPWLRPNDRHRIGISDRVHAGH